MDTQPLFSADSHVVEPNSFWEERVDKKFRDRAPRVVRNEHGIMALVIPGLPPGVVAQDLMAGKRGEEFRKSLRGGFEQAPGGAWDPDERLKAQEVDGVVAEVIYPSQGLRLCPLRDADLQHACFRVYNDWIAEFCSHHPDRLLGVGLIPLAGEVGEGVKELERCAKLGLRGGIIPIMPAADRPYSSKEYEPLWQAASELGLPLSLHAATGPTLANVDPVGGGVRFSIGETVAEGILAMLNEIQQSLAAIVCTGVLERFPNLRLVSVENNVGWFAYFARVLDARGDQRTTGGPPTLRMKASEYLRRQVYATFQDDSLVGHTYKIFGENNFMWASDFPHGASTWPNSRQVIARNFENVPSEVTRKIVFDNAARFYGWSGAGSR